MNAHFLTQNPFEPRFRIWTILPPVTLPSCPEKDAKWVIVPFRCMMNRDKDRDAIKLLVEKYGSERLVLFDYSDQGDGNYPCTVFAQNTKHSFPANVHSYVDPMWEKFEDGMPLPTPTRKEKKYDFTFCGDGTSHESRRNGVLECDKLSEQFNCLFKFNRDGWLCGDDTQDAVYLDSFNTRLMWCPPSRRPITGRLCEAMAAGVPIITQLEDFRRGDYLSFLNLIPHHNYSGMFLEDQVSDLLCWKQMDENAAVYHKHFVHYRDNFWRYILAELNGEEPPI